MTLSLITNEFPLTSLIVEGTTKFRYGGLKKWLVKVKSR